MDLFKMLRRSLLAIGAVLMMYGGIELISLKTNTLYTAFADHPEQIIRLKEKEK